MKGKVKYVTRNVWYAGNAADQYSSDIHNVRFTTTNAILYDGKEVVIDEDDIKSYYDRSRITDKLVNTISESLHNIWINYSEDNDGVYHLDGNLEDYL